MALWAASGNGPVALSLLMDAARPRLAAAVLSNTFTFDINGTGVADAARTYRFANPTAGQSVDSLPIDVPLCVVRSGRDENPGLNEDDTDASRFVIGQMVEFLRFYLRAR